MELSISVYRCLASFLILFYGVGSVSGALRPRGVPLSRKVFYNPSQKFSCLDGSGTFPFHFVNDDYCDCADGSDEPGTAACPNGVFYCFNLGFKSETIPSSRVNDGICDCCDTSDEYNSTADCFNNCKELGQQELNAALAFYKSFMQGYEIRESYIKIGKQRREEFKAVLDNSEKRLNDALHHKLLKQDIKEKYEEQENSYVRQERQMKEAQAEKIAAEKARLLQRKKAEEAEGKIAFEQLDLNGDGKVCIAEMMSFPIFDYDHDGTVSEKEAKFFMHKKEEVSFDEFISTGWKVMKHALKLDEVPGEAMDSSSVTNEACSKMEGESIKDSCAPTNKISGTTKEPMEPPPDDIKAKEAIFKEAAIARKEFAEASKILQDAETEKWAVKQKLAADFGSDDEFLALEHQCFDLADKRYLYRFCPFDKIVQLQRPSNSETLVGLWEKWSGSEGNIYAQMKYDGGNICWNGPHRSAEVNLKCGLENKLLSVEECSPCTYVLEFSTPASCKNLPSHIQEALDRQNLLIV